MSTRRLKLFYKNLGGFSWKNRIKRMRLFKERLGLEGGERVIDLGGTVSTWQMVDVPLDITVLNLPDAKKAGDAHPRHTIRVLDGDACDVSDFADMSFDIAFSNSVIEHVGGPDRRRQFAAEARRLAPKYWVQTPAIWFPLEAHTGLPFWWFYPDWLKRRFMRDWEQRIPNWAEMIRGTDIVRRGELEALFPDGRIWTERLWGIPKSYVVTRR